MFYSSSINSLQDFEDYCNSRGLKVFSAAEIPNDGYYAEVERGSSNVGHFTQNRLSKPHWLNGKAEFPMNQKTEWVRLSFKDSNNTYIINAK